MVVLTILLVGDASQHIKSFEFPEIIPLMTVMVKPYIRKITKLLYGHSRALILNLAHNNNQINWQKHNYARSGGVKSRDLSRQHSVSLVRTI